ncbi:MAG: hypothetical protein ACU841_16665, partial [Gammaproteobacteria bacterium]
TAQHARFMRAFYFLVANIRALSSLAIHSDRLIGSSTSARNHRFLDFVSFERKLGTATGIVI